MPGCQPFNFQAPTIGCSRLELDHMHAKHIIQHQSTASSGQEVKSLVSKPKCSACKQNGCICTWCRASGKRSKQSSVSPEWQGLTMPVHILTLSREAGKQPCTEPCPHLHAIMPRQRISVKKLGLVVTQLKVESARSSGGTYLAGFVAFDPVRDPRGSYCQGRAKRSCI